MARSAIHPGEHLADAIAGLGVTAAQLAHDIEVPPNRISGILRGRRAVTADTALRLGRYFGTSAEFWMNLQQIYDLRLAEREIGKRLGAIPRGRPCASSQPRRRASAAA
jgi:addiction module HigA family antidote